MTLLEVSVGTTVQVVSLHGGGGLRSRLTQHGLYEGDTLRVLRLAPLGGPVLVEVNGREIALGRGVAQKIQVEPVPCASP
jgi:ferrous iron transport protein A